MRSKVRQENPSLSNTEASKLLGKMWKEVPNDVKLQYKQKAAQLQEEFKKTHPDYTYRKARRKRALNELLTKSSQGMAPGMMIPGMEFPYNNMMTMMPGVQPQQQQMFQQQQQSFPGMIPQPMNPSMMGQQMPMMQQMPMQAQGMQQQPQQQMYMQQPYH